jgi:cytoskeletal protein CcmA (bactofilin family)
MFPSKPDLSADKQLSPSAQTAARGQTMIAQGMRVEGIFKGQGQVAIDGELKGELVVDGALSVGSAAVIEANVQSKEAIISGTVRGNVAVEGRLECASTASIKGDIRCGVLVVQAGAVMKGALHVGTDDR